MKENIAYIANFFWKSSIDTINATLSSNEIHNFNMNDYYYLTVIYQLGNPNLGEVANALNLTKPSISAMVQRLIKNELIIKAQSDKDKRVHYLSLTEKGLKIMQGDDALYEDLAESLTSVLNEQQLDDINCLLNLLVQKMQTTNEEHTK
jgi:DNA-binding MarR family transcriptional regulator